MGLHTIAPDNLVTCPLDEAHRILKSRMQFHLVRCLKNHKLDNKLLKCPWNPLHIIDRFSYEDHYTNRCEDLPNAMGSAWRSKWESEDEIHRDVASIPVNATNAVLPIPEEDWDADPKPAGTYDPFKRAEGLPVLRPAVGLSKAKKKAWIQAERRRHQQLEDTLPLPMKFESKIFENVDVTKTVRPPRSQQIAMSANASMADDMNASRNSENNEKLVKLPTTVRTPHAPSPSLTYEIPKTQRDESVTLFDETYGFDDSIYGLNTSSRNAKYETIRKLIEQQPVAAKKSFAAVASSSGLQNKVLTNESSKTGREIELQDEAASLPDSVETDPDDDIVDQLSQRLANLETMQRSIEEEKTALMAQILQLTPKSNNSIASVNLEQRKEKPPINSIANGFSKCAANFPKLKNSKNSPISGIGRGIVIDHQSMKNPRPGTSRDNTGAAERK